VPPPTGIAVYTRSVLLALAARRAFPLTGLAHRPVRDREELATAGIALEDAPARLPLGVAWQQLELPRTLERLQGQGRADLLWSPLMTLPLATRRPAVVTVYDLTFLLFPETHRLKVRLSLLPFLERSVGKARRIITLSHATARDLAFHFPEHRDRVRVVGAGVDPRFRPGTASEVAAIRQELDAPGGYLLYVGALEPRKNVGALVTAWAHARSHDDTFPPLVLAGDAGWHNRALLRRIAVLAPHGLLHLGRVDGERLVRLYQGAWAFAYPSLYEGFGLPPLEAMACGVPVVATTAASLPEVVGDAGLLVPPGSAESLAAALVRLWTEPQRAAELAQRGLERARRFTWDAAAAGLEEVFREALAGGA
jgi:glycosyltransferase involved in cell wall biosynthesis